MWQETKKTWLTLIHEYNMLFALVTKLGAFPKFLEFNLFFFSPNFVYLKVLSEIAWCSGSQMMASTMRCRMGHCDPSRIHLPGAACCRRSTSAPNTEAEGAHPAPTLRQMSFTRDSQGILVTQGSGVSGWRWSLMRGEGQMGSKCFHWTLRSETRKRCSFSPILSSITR